MGAQQSAAKNDRKCEVIRLHMKNYDIGWIARTVGISKRTAERYLTEWRRETRGAMGEVGSH